jgi:hypothetical protein
MRAFRVVCLAILILAAPLTTPMRAWQQNKPEDEKADDKDKKEEGLVLKTDSTIEFTTDSKSLIGVKLGSDQGQNRNGTPSTAAYG